jgi:hypothetical protein
MPSKESDTVSTFFQLQFPGIFLIQGDKRGQTRYVRLI